MSSYPYKPLNLPHETRILTILPGELSDPLVCRLSHLDLNSDEPFEALSYCWGKSIVHGLDLDAKVLASRDPPGSPENPVLICARDLLGVDLKEYIYRRFGGPLPAGTINCDGYDMPVGGELLRALQCVRDKTEPLRIWVDAICIHQESLAERNIHITMMTSVYANASRVRVWIGDGIGLEREIFKVLDDLNDIFIDLKEGLEGASTLLERQQLCSSHPKWSSVEWSILAQFFDRAWFERVWVVQEVANAKQAVFQTGHCMIGWNSLTSHIDLLGKCRLTEQIPHPTATANLLTMISVRRDMQAGRPVPERSIPSFLQSMRNFKSTLPSDKIYGVLSVLDPEFSIDVDYSKPAESLYTELATRYLQGDSLDLLYYCGEPHHPTTLDLPSWVPDWTKPQWTSPFFSRGLKYKAAGDTKPHFSIDESLKTLHVKGRLLDTVEIVNDKAEIPIVQFNPYDWITVDPDLGAEGKAKMMSLRSRRKKRDADENMLLLAWPWPQYFDWEKYDNMWRTFICNRLHNNEVPSDHYGLAWEDHMEWRYNSTVKDDDEDDTGPYHKLLMGPFLDGRDVRQRREYKQFFRGRTSNEVSKAHHSWCYNRRFFISGDERYGWAVDGTLAGDKVAIFYGCDFPFLLREAGDNTYKIVGDCYIHGLMEGEALKDEFEEITLVIS